MSMLKPYTGPWFSYPTAGEIIAAGTVLPILAIIAVILRFCVRSRQQAAVGLDDWLTIPALLLFIGMCIGLLDGFSKKAIGYPSPPDNISNAGQGSPQEVTITKIAWAIEIMMALAYGAIKLSVLFFYRRLFVVNRNTPFDIVTKVAIVVVTLWTITFFFLIIFYCGVHIDAIWGNVIEAAEVCPDGFKAGMAFFASDFGTDALVLLLPLPTIWGLNMNLTRKITITAILSLGAMALAASATRVAIYSEIKMRGYDPLEDINLVSSTTLYWSTLEAGLSIIAICLPTLRPLFARKSMDSIVRSVRGVMSLGSVTSSHNRDTANATTDHYTEIEEHGIKTAHAVYLTRPDGQVESYAMHNQSERSPKNMPGVIHVESQLAQENSMV